MNPSASRAHHDQARFTWELGPGSADAVVIGFDSAERDADGRLALALGFFEEGAVALTPVPADLGAGSNQTGLTPRSRRNQTAADSYRRSCPTC